MAALRSAVAAKYLAAKLALDPCDESGLGHHPPRVRVDCLVTRTHAVDRTCASQMTERVAERRRTPDVHVVLVATAVDDERIHSLRDPRTFCVLGDLDPFIEADVEADFQDVDRGVGALKLRLYGLLDTPLRLSVGEKRQAANELLFRERNVENERPLRGAEELDERALVVGPAWADDVDYDERPAALGLGSQALEGSLDLALGVA